MSVTERELGLEHRHQAALEAYYDRMTGLLLRDNLQTSAPEDVVRNIARARTLAVLCALDGGRQALVLCFL
jgi:hypothetical protein